MMPTSAAVAPWTDREAWAKFVENSPQGSIFLHPAFLDALGARWEVVRVGAGDDPAVAAVLLTDSTGGMIRAPHPFTQYQGLLLGFELANQPAHRRGKVVLDAVTDFLDGLRDQGALSWCLHPSFPDLRPFSWFNYHDAGAGRFAIEVRYSGVIELMAGESLESMLGRCRAVRRQEFRKASQRFTVSASLDVDLLDELHEATFRRQGLERPPADAGLLRSIARAALRDGFGEMFVAHDGDGTAAGAVLYLFDASTAYYLVAANDPRFRSSGVSTLLFLAGVERALRRGLGAVDVVGMNSPGRADFKASFGAVPRPYYLVDWRRP